MHIRDGVDAFLLAGGADGLKKTTLRWYGSLLKTFLNHVGERPVESFTVNDLRAYMVHLRQQQYSDDSLHDHGRALKRFWNWYSNEYQVENPMRNIKYPKQPKPKVPKAVTSSDVIKLLGACGNSPLGKRDKALVSFLMDSGARADETVSIRNDEIDLERGRAYVVGKGSKRRVVFFTDITALLIREWTQERNLESDYLFHADNGEPLKPNGLGQMLRRLKRKARVTGRVNPHAFRHGFAREFILNGGSLATLSRILGHESQELTTAYYAIFEADELASAHRAYSPVRKLESVIRNEENNKNEGSG